MRYQITYQVSLKNHPKVPLTLDDTLWGETPEEAQLNFRTKHGYRYLFHTPVRTKEIA